MLTPRFESAPKMFCIGITYYGNNDQGQIPKLWDTYGKMFRQIKNCVEPWRCAGVETYEPDFDSTGKWFYTAAAIVTSLDEIPVGLVGKIIPASDYAVFTIQGKLDKLGDTIKSIYKEWLPQSGKTIAAPYDLEMYDARFKGPQSDESVMEMWLPIK